MFCFDDEELSKVKAACFRGLARVQLDALNFQHPLAFAEECPAASADIWKSRLPTAAGRELYQRYR